MAKGKRIREERRQLFDAHQAVGELFQIEEASRFLAWNERYGPHRDAILEHLAGWCEKPTIGPSFRPWYELVIAAAGAPGAAWDEMEETKAELAARETSLEADLEDAIATLAAGDPLGASAAIDQALSQAEMVPLLRGP